MFSGAMSLEQLEEAIDGAGNGVSPSAKRVGIIPDLMVRPTVQGIAPGRDEVLEVAVHYLETGEEGEKDVRE